ncbi:MULTISPECIES: bifunctional serine/threonine-protein kinase/glutamate ABC transporter substrate-binding protein [Streptomyces]|uniref:bifunctional serine/threonine-protein kinase/glutamate ABC transporter substrate-binding protein n=1 Tax=Streptomyces TaxID=1883 RepID=UPI00178301BD|nr:MULTISPECIES: bifunctional serine/threonine-protein kinase/glutamate ABC transporter substrate-binding protein [Streptomyces]MCF0086154.1 Serine/threonine-protein kinase PknA [Streptomyces sp. MH192]GHE48718.1 serine/threonine protein kinase [Streptomyces griseoaurantiacus]
MHNQDGSNGVGGGPDGHPEDRVPAPHAVIEGRYELLEPVGSGGMGEVWKSYDRRLRRFVAVKGLLDTTAASPDTKRAALQRARREAEALAKIEHQNVVTVHDQIETADQVWIVMKLLEGRSLADLLSRDGVLGVPRAADIGLQMAQGLRAVHEAAVLHRDVKPGNVLVRDGGQVVLVDFGIATFEGADRVTRYGGVIGTPPYLAPELFAPGSPGPTRASDLWALGVTLYEMVEGRLPFAGREVWEVQAHIQQAPEPVFRYAGPLGPVIRALLVTDPAGRPDAASAEEMLREVLAEPGTPPPARAAGSTPPPTAPTTPPTPALVLPGPGPGPGPEPATPAGAVPPELLEPAPRGERGRRRGWKVAAAAACVVLLAGGGWVLAQNGSGGGRDDVSGRQGAGSGGVDTEQAWQQWKNARKRLTIGAKEDQPGLSLHDRKGVWSGFDIDIAYALARELGYDKKQVDFYGVTTANRASKLRNGEVDLVVASYSMTPEREKRDGIRFVGPYYKAGTSLLVRRKSARYDLDEAVDVKRNHVDVCTARDSTYADRLRKDGYTTGKWQPDTYKECVKRLLDRNSSVYAVASDDVLLAGYAKDDPAHLKLLPSGSGTEPYGVAMRKDDPLLRGRVCSALRKILAGAEWPEMYMKDLSPLTGRKTAPNRPELQPCPGE